MKQNMTSSAYRLNEGVATTVIPIMLKQSSCYARIGIRLKGPLYSVFGKRPIIFSLSCSL